MFHFNVCNWNICYRKNTLGGNLEKIEENSQQFPGLLFQTHFHVFPLTI